MSLIALPQAPVAPSSDQPATIVKLRLDDLGIAATPRSDGVSAEHVRLLVESGGGWAPILVDRDTRTIIDGIHRYHASRALKLTTVDCEIFYGDADDAFVEAVRRNTVHGLPLRLRDRQRAAARMLGIRPGWSDRRIAEACGLSHRTVGSLRRQLGGSTGQLVQLNRREGKDGRVRPSNREALRSAIADTIEAHPNESLRKIAERVGTTPATVRAVRSRLNGPSSGVPMELPQTPSDRSRLNATPEKAELVDSPAVASTETRWSGDPALTTMPMSNDFLGWFTTTSIDEDCTRYASLIPMSRVYEVADEARRRAAQWIAFARALESRCKR